jgi:aminopeptidase N
MLGVALAVVLQVPSALAVVDDTIRTNVNALHYEIAITLPDTGAEIAGRTTLTYLVRRAGPLRLDFDTAFTVDSVTQTARAAAWHRTVNGDIVLANDARPGDTVVATIAYHGAPHDGLIIRDDVHGARTAFADNWPNRAHHWFPGIDHPSDKATAAFDVDAPPGWEVVANGSLAGVDTLPDGRTRWRWVEHHRIPVYTMVIGAGRLAITSMDTADGIPVSLWTEPEDSSFAVNGPFRRADLIVGTFARLFGPFPYEKLAHVESSTRFGGMENSSAIFYDEKAYASHRMSEATVAHETTHQWFGDGVTEYDWHHLWLSEGFATYFAAVFYQQIGEDSTFREALARDKRAYFASADTARPVIDTTEHDLFRLLNRNNYQKGALVLHMLRHEIGDSAFFAGLRDYERTYRDSTALTSDLARVMARHAGRSLDWFFDQWLLQPGYPRLRTSWTYDAAHHTARITVREVQPAAWGTYRLTIPAEMLLADGTIQNFEIHASGRLTTVTRTGVGTEPKSVTLDPNGDLLMKQEQ